MPATPASEVEGKGCTLCGADATHIYGDMYVCYHCHPKSSELEIEQAWEEFWVPIIMSNGELDIAQIKRELFDYRQFMTEVSKVYDHITGGVISKANTKAAAVRVVFEDRLRKMIDEELSDSKENTVLFELMRWGTDGNIHLYHEDSLHGNDIDIVLDATHPCANGKRVDIVCFLRNLVLEYEKETHNTKGETND